MTAGRFDPGAVWDLEAMHNQSQQSYRLHWLAILAPILVALGLLYANLDGYQNHVIGEGEFFGEPPAINWTHGWPCCFLVRSSIYPLSGNVSPTGAITGDVGFHSRWPTDHAPVLAIWVFPLFVDAAFFVILAAATAYGAQRLSLRLKIANRFGLKSLFALMTLVALACVVGLPAIMGGQFRIVFQAVAFAIILASVLVSLFGVIDASLRLRRRINVLRQPA